MSDRGLQQVQAEVAPDDGAEVQDGVRVLGQAVDALHDDLLQMGVAAERQRAPEAVALVHQQLGQRAFVAVGGEQPLLQVAQRLGDEEGVALGGKVEELPQLRGALALFPDELVDELFHFVLAEAWQDSVWLWG